jgi:hypothetical protein
MRAPPESRSRIPRPPWLADDRPWLASASCSWLLAGHGGWHAAFGGCMLVTALGEVSASPDLRGWLVAYGGLLRRAAMGCGLARWPACCRNDSRPPWLAGCLRRPAWVGCCGRLAGWVGYRVVGTVSVTCGLLGRSAACGGLLRRAALGSWLARVASLLLELF